MTLEQEAYQYILNKIQQQEWLPGFPLREQELSKDLQMSRTPIRQALMRLYQDGHVDREENKGMRVSYQLFTQKEVQDRLEFLELMLNDYLRRLQTREYPYPSDDLDEKYQALLNLSKAEDSPFYEAMFIFLDEILRAEENRFYVALIHQTLTSLIKQKGKTQQILRDSRDEILEHFGNLVDYLSQNDYPYARREVRILINQLILNVFQGARQR